MFDVAVIGARDPQRLKAVFDWRVRGDAGVYLGSGDHGDVRFERQVESLSNISLHVGWLRTGDSEGR